MATFKSYLNSPDECMSEPDTWWKEARKTLWNLKTSLCPADYDEYVISKIPQMDEREILTIKLCYLMFGAPNEDDSISSNSRYEFQLDEEFEEMYRKYQGESVAILSMYQPKQIKKAKQLTSAICDLERQSSSKLYAGIIFVCLKMFNSQAVEGKALPVPIIRVLKESRSDNRMEDVCWFVDLDGRTYKSWEDYLASNKLPEGEICFPINGIYSTRPISPQEDESAALLLDRAKTPACSLLNKVLFVTNTAMTIASFGALAIAVAGLAVTVAPVVATAGASVGAASMIYGGTRSVTTLVDRGLHKQTLTPKDAESRMAWIGIAGAALATGSAQATSALADIANTGDKIGKSMEYTVNLVNTSSIGVSAIGMVNHGYHIIKSYQEERTFSAFDLLQLSLSALLLTHSLVNFQTAKQIIKETSKAPNLTEFENHLDSKKHRPGAFQDVKAALKTIRLDKLQKRQPRTIRTVRQIDDSREFFARAFEMFDAKHSQSFSFDDTGNFIIDGTKFSAESLLKLSKIEQSELLRDLELILKGEIRESEVAARVKEWIDTQEAKERDISSVLSSISSVLQDRDIKILTLKELNQNIWFFTRLFDEVPDKEDIKRVLLLAIQAFYSLEFQTLKSLFQIIITINKQLSNKPPTKITEDEALAIITEAYFAQMCQPSSSSPWKYSDPVKAVQDYDNYLSEMMARELNPLPPPKYWKEVQEFFEFTEVLDVREHDTSNLIYSFEGDKFSGEIFQSSGQHAICSILNFGIFKPKNVKTLEKYKCL